MQPSALVNVPNQDIDWHVGPPKKEREKKGDNIGSPSSQLAQGKSRQRNVSKQKNTNDSISITVSTTKPTPCRELYHRPVLQILVHAQCYKYSYKQPSSVKNRIAITTGTVHLCKESHHRRYKHNQSGFAKKCNRYYYNTITLKRYIYNFITDT